MGQTLWIRSRQGRVRHLAEGVWAPGADHRLRSSCGALRANFVDDHGHGLDINRIFVSIGRAAVEFTFDSEADGWDQPICAACVREITHRGELLMEQVRRTGMGTPEWHGRSKRAKAALAKAGAA